MGIAVLPPARNLEREVKLDLDVATPLPDLRQVVGRSVRLPTQTLRTVYFDTSDQRLRRLGLSLRHRQGDDDGDTWTLKLPSAVEHRMLERTELNWTGTVDAIPPATAALLMGVVRRRSLEPVVELSTTRQRLVFGSARKSGGRPAALELDDDTVTVVGGEKDGTRFRQLEVEQHEQDEQADGLLDRVVRELRRTGARPTKAPKLARALGDVGLAPSLSTRPVTVGDVVVASIADGSERLLNHDIPLRLEEGGPPVYDVHQARVGTRRLRSNLKTFAPLLDPVWVEHTRAELAWLGDLLGAVRDVDVLWANLDDQAIRVELEAQRRVVTGPLAQAMASARYTDLLDRLDAAMARPPFYDFGADDEDRTATVRADSPARAGLAVLVGEEWRTVRRRVQKAGRHPSDHELHKIRIAAKRLRYASEAATSAVGTRARRTARQAEKLQKILGEHHDAVAAHAWLQQFAATAPPATAFRAGLLAAEQENRQLVRRGEWRRVFRRLRAKKRRAWLD